MGYADRFQLPGHVWHITHRCYKRDYLLCDEQERRNWRFWLYESKKRFGLCVLNYIATSNHVHLLVYSRGKAEITRSLAYIADRSAQQYYLKTGQCAPFWENRFYATAVDLDAYLMRCIVYIDLNMVRAGIVRHPREWDVCGYREITGTVTRIPVIDQHRLSHLCGFKHLAYFKRAYDRWIQHALSTWTPARQKQWTQCAAVGSHQYVTNLRHQICESSRRRTVSEGCKAYTLHEAVLPYQLYSR